MDQYRRKITINWPAALLAVPLVILQACRQGEFTAYINQEFRVSGFVQGTDGALLSGDLSFSSIGKDGLRHEASRSSFDPSSGSFSFAVDEETLLTRYAESLPELLAEMGANIVVPAAVKGSFGQSPEGHVRFEAIQQDWESQSGAADILYSQAVFGVPLSIRANNDNSVIIASEAVRLTVGKVGSVPVKIVDSTSVPIAGAIVSVIPITSEDLSGGRARPLMPWKASAFSPVAALSSDEGEARVLPIPSAVTYPRFQVVATKEGYCTNATSQLSYPPVPAELPITLTLKTCDEDSKLANPFAWKASHAAEIFTTTESDRVIGYYNSSIVKIAMALEGLYTHGFSVVAYDGFEKAGVPIAKVDFPTFAPSYEIDLSPEFLAKSTSVGNFMIEITPRVERSDIPTTPQRLYGKYSKTETLASGADFSLLSITEEEGIISGVPGQKSILRLYSSTTCDSGDKVSLILNPEPSTLSRSNLQYFDCVKGDMIFETANLYTGLFSISGEYQITVVIKNRYGNISSKTIGTSDRITAKVDFGVPNLQVGILGDPLSFGFDFGIAAIAETSPYVFGTSQIRLSSANISTFKLTFESPSKCRIIESVMGSDFHKVFDFRMAATSGEVDASIFSNGTNCQSGSVQLSSNLISIPTGGVGEASFYLQLRDLAGNVSAPREYLIPACAASPAADYCWEN